MKATDNEQLSRMINRIRAMTPDEFRDWSPWRTPKRGSRAPHVSEYIDVVVDAHVPKARDILARFEARLRADEDATDIVNEILNEHPSVLQFVFLKVLNAPDIEVVKRGHHWLAKHYMDAVGVPLGEAGIGSEPKLIEDDDEDES